MIISKDFAELIGALIGDGHIYRRNRKYQIGFTGNPITDKKYFEYLKKLILKEWNKNAKIKKRGRGIRMVIDSKEICNLLIDVVGIPHGEGKCEKVFIPHEIFRDWKLCKRTIRGIVDTDGTVFVARKPRVEKYPSIEIATSSKLLAKQIKEVLQKQGFRVAKIWGSKSKNSKRITYRVPLNGKTNLNKWVEEIGFSNPYKMNRAISYLKN